MNITETEPSCSICWLGYELQFAFDEFGRRLPDRLEVGVGTMLGDVDVPTPWSHDVHDVEPHVFEAAADAAELIATFRGTNVGATRPRVMAMFCDDCRLTSTSVRTPRW